MDVHPLIDAGRRPWREGRAFLLHVVAPLVLGSAVYVLWRGRGLRLLDWIDAVGFAHFMDAARGWAGTPLPRPFVDVLPDALWAYSLGAALGLVWLGGTPRMRALWLSAAGVVTCMMEFGQAVSLVPGTFDWFDLVAMVTGFAAGAWRAPRGVRPRG